METQNLVQISLTGIAFGSIYALMACGLLVTYLTSHALNFGQGSFLMLGAFLSMSMGRAGIPVVALVPVTIVLMLMLGMLLELVAIRPLARGGTGKNTVGWILTTLGAGLVLQNAAQLVWGKSRYDAPPLFSEPGNQTLQLFGASVYREEIAAAAVALTLIAAFHLLLTRSAIGRDINTVAFDPDTARLLGIDVRRVTIVSYAAMGVFAGFAGVLLAPITTVETHMGFLLLLKGFAVVCIAGFSSPIGILVCAIGFGLVEAYSNYFNSELGDLFPFVLAMVSLVLRPTGIFAERKVHAR